MEKILKSKEIIPNVWHHNGQCVPGVRRLFIDIFGNFYPCEKVIEKKSLQIGNLEKGFNKKRISNMLNIGKLTGTECKRCWAIRFCDMCVSSCYDVNCDKITKLQKTYYCKLQREKALDFFKNYILMHQTN